ncbi:MAG TPA: haloacid dehalogenase type II [Sphingomicrobium sp.]|nr:haloacid dehalogenase type II [Sphingomicrobium sp.]
MRLSDFKALSFDCYGTLIDWETGILAALRSLRERAGVGDGELLTAFGEVEHAVEVEHPGLAYAQLLERVHAGLSHRFGVGEDEVEAAKLGASVGDWPPFPDSAEALRYLKQHFQLIILSNVDRLSFAGSQRQLGVEFDHVFTAQDIGSYKPDLRNFEYLLDRLAAQGIAKEELLHVAQSLFHDHVPANRMGIASAWIDRRHDKPGSGATVMPDPMPRYDFRFTSLGELAEAHRAESG